MKKLYHFSFLIAFILLFSINSCKKEAKNPIPVPVKVADNHVKPEEINAWFDAMPQVKPAPFLLNAAQQAIINGIQVVRIPIATNAALYFTKENDSLKVYAYKWIYNTSYAENFTGNLDAYSFQSKNFIRLTYSNGKLINRLLLASNKQEAQLLNTNSQLRPNYSLADYFTWIWCELTGGTPTYGSDIGCWRGYNNAGGGGSSGGGGSGGGFPIYGSGGSSSGGSGFTGSGGGSGGGAAWGPPPCPPTTTVGVENNKLKVNQLITDPNDPGYTGGGGTGCVVVNNGQWNPYLYSLFSKDPATDDPNFSFSNYINVNDIDYNLAIIPEQPLYTEDSSDDYVGYEFDPNVDADFIDVKIDPTFSSNAQVSAIYNKLKSQHTLQKMLSRFFGKHNPINLEFKVENLSDTLRLAETRPIGSAPNPYTNRIVIVIDGTKAATRPDLMVAKTIIHEVIHAQIFRYIKLDQLGILPSEYHKILTAMATYWSKFQRANPKFDKQDWDHGYMAQHYLATIAVALKEFDNNSNVPLCFYKMLAWEGLKQTPYWSKLNSTRQTAINNAISNYKNNQTISPCAN